MHAHRICSKTHFLNSLFGPIINYYKSPFPNHKNKKQNKTRYIVCKNLKINYPLQVNTQLLYLVTVCNQENKQGHKLALLHHLNSCTEACTH